MGEEARKTEKKRKYAVRPRGVQGPVPSSDWLGLSCSLSVIGCSHKDAAGELIGSGPVGGASESCRRNQGAGAAGALVSAPAVSAGLAGPAASDAADTRPWEPPGLLHFRFPPRGATPG